MHALNHVMVHRGRTLVDRDILDDIAHNVAAMENATSTGHALAAPNPEGNYHVTVLSLALKQLADVFVHVWTDTNHSNNNYGYIIGNGRHWQALLRTPDGWSVLDRFTYQVHNLRGFLRMSSRRGMVLALNLEPSSSGDMDWEVRQPSRKRTLQEVLAIDAPDTSLITGHPASIPPPNIEPEEKKTRSDSSTMGDTQEALLQVKDEQYHPLVDETTDRVTRSAISQPTDPQWQEITVGVTRLYHSPVLNMYRCINCDFQRPTPLGVTSHFGKYCSKSTASANKGDAIDVEEGS